MNKIMELVENKEFFEKLKNCKNENDFSELVAQYGISLDGIDAETAFAQFKSGVAEVKEGSVGELSEEELIAVAGGASWNPFYWIGRGIGWVIKKGAGISDDVCWY